MRRGARKLLVFLLRGLRWGVGAGMALTAFVLVAGLCGARLNTSGSLPRGVYWQVSGPVQRGDVVMFCLDDSQAAYGSLARERGYLSRGPCPNGLIPLGKKVFGMPGDSVRIGPDGVTVNGKHAVGPALRWDSEGREMPPSILRSGIIPSGKVLLLSDYSPLSFDGRYFGLTNLNDCTKTKPFLIFD